MEAGGNDAGLIILSEVLKEVSVADAFLPMAQGVDISWREKGDFWQRWRNFISGLWRCGKGVHLSKHMNCILQRLIELVSESCSVVSNSLRPHGLGPWNSPGQNTGVGLFQGNRPDPGIEPRSPALQADSLAAEPQWKPKNTGVGSLFLLQWIFLTQESNWGLLHGRWILYLLSYEVTIKGLYNDI